MEEEEAEHLQESDREQLAALVVSVVVVVVVLRTVMEVMEVSVVVEEPEEPPKAAMEVLAAVEPLEMEWEEPVLVLLPPTVVLGLHLVAQFL